MHLPIPHIAYHCSEVVARYGEHLVADALLHATVKGMEGDTGITVAEALLQYIQYAAHLKNAVPDRRGVDEKDADGGVQLHHRHRLVVTEMTLRPAAEMILL